MATDCPFATLGVEPGADPNSIRQAFRRAVQISHPDRGGAVHRFVQVMAAMDSLRESGALDAAEEIAQVDQQALRPLQRFANPYAVMMAGLADVSGLDPLPVVPQRRQTRNGQRFASILDQQLKAS
jgi:curved DNA-binding protein CbpA